MKPPNDILEGYAHLRKTFDEQEIRRTLRGALHWMAGPECPPDGRWDSAIQFQIEAWLPNMSARLRATPLQSLFELAWWTLVASPLVFDVRVDESWGLTARCERCGRDGLLLIRLVVMDNWRVVCDDCREGKIWCGGKS